MLGGLDSSYDQPTLAQAQAARAAGVRIWGGYLATQQQPGAFNLAAPWSRDAFQTLQQAELLPLGFCSGWDDPAALRLLAASWGVIPCLDCESGIRDLGSWTQGWVDAAGAGIYGLAPVQTLQARFHILADYPGYDPGVIWPSWLGRPAGLLGWQWQGTHSEFGLSVDRSWFDDGFLSLGGDLMSALSDDDQVLLFNRVWKIANYLENGTDANQPPGGPWIANVLTAIDGDVAPLAAQAQAQATTLQGLQATLAALKAEVEAGGQVDAAAAIARIEKALQAA